MRTILLIGLASACALAGWLYVQLDVERGISASLLETVHADQRLRTDIRVGVTRCEKAGGRFVMAFARDERGISIESACIRPRPV